MQYTKERSKESIFSAVLLKCTSDFLHSEINKKKPTPFDWESFAKKKSKRNTNVWTQVAKSDDQIFCYYLTVSELEATRRQLLLRHNTKSHSWKTQW